MQGGIPENRIRARGTGAITFFTQFHVFSLKWKRWSTLHAPDLRAAIGEWWTHTGE